VKVYDCGEEKLGAARSFIQNWILPNEISEFCILYYFRDFREIIFVLENMKILKFN
jgi:hypothetical protein